jgi:hypothetical protein
MIDAIRDRLGTVSKALGAAATNAGWLIGERNDRLNQATRIGEGASDFIGRRSGSSVASSGVTPRLSTQKPAFGGSSRR